MKFILVVSIMLLIGISGAVTFPQTDVGGVATDTVIDPILGEQNYVLPGAYIGTTRIDCTSSGIFGNQIANWVTTYIKKPRTIVAVFQTSSTNLGYEKHGIKTYMKDVTTGELILIKDGARFPAISPDGKYIIYERCDNNDYSSLPKLYLYNIASKSETFVDYTSGGNEAGWKSQTFKWLSNTQVQYETSYGGTWKTKTYTV